MNSYGLYNISVDSDGTIGGFYASPEQAKYLSGSWVKGIYIAIAIMFIIDFRTFYNAFRSQLGMY